MGKEPGKLMVGVTSIFCVLFLLNLHYEFFSSDVDTWKQKFSEWRQNHPRDDKARQGSSSDEEPLEFLLRRLVRGEDRALLETKGFTCRSNHHTDICIASKLVRINYKEQAIYISGTQDAVQRTIKPHPREGDPAAMRKVTPVKLVHGNTTDLPPCNFTHTVPAVVFSSGGFTGNTFHEINELIIPLFLTCRHFQARLQFVITDYKGWWVSKYKQILAKLSSYNVIGPSMNESVHCFPGAVIGLTYHDHITIKSTEIPGGYSLFDFKHFLRQTYGLKIKKVSEIEKPVVLFISRTKSRKFLNEYEIVRLMEELGFKVIIARSYRMSNLNKFAEVVNSCNVVVGAHGEGLANEVFLPDGAVVVQVVPLGLDWQSTTYFGNPTSRLGLQYLEYRIEPEESSLLDQYGRDHPVITDPKSIFFKSNSTVRSIYFAWQNLKINVSRFKKTLVKAMELISVPTPSS